MTDPVDRSWPGLMATLVKLPASLLIGLTRLYQLLISPWLGARCRFAPTCSEYMIQSLRKYGAIRGLFRGVRRILKCHPFHPGGYDPP